MGEYGSQPNSEGTVNRYAHTLFTVFSLSKFQAMMVGIVWAEPVATSKPF